MPEVLVASLTAADIDIVLQGLGYETVTVSDGVEALRICGDAAPYAVIADAILPGIDGFALAKRIRALGTVCRPGVVVMYLPGMGRRLDLTGTAMIEKPVRTEALCEALDSVAVEKRRADKAGRHRLEAVLDELGLPDHPGREYLADAAFLAGEDMSLLSRLTGRLYPMVAARFGTDSDAVERAMRRVIEEAWRYGSIEKQYEMFRNTIDAAKGKPTCGEMIAQLSELLRREG